MLRTGTAEKPNGGTEALTVSGILGKIFSSNEKKIKIHYQWQSLLQNIYGCIWKLAEHIGGRLNATLLLASQAVHHRARREGGSIKCTWDTTFAKELH